MSEAKPYLIVPIETKAREFDAKVYLAGLAAEKGFKVILGEQNAVLRNAGRIPSGIYCDKSIAPPKVPHFKRLKKLGNRLVASCEEGLVFHSRKHYQAERVMPTAFSQVDLFFAWGQEQEETISEYIEGAEEKIIRAGNPRFDLLRPELREYYRPQVNELNNKYGNFILINTNFGRFNHFFDKKVFLEQMKERGLLATPESREYYEGWIDFLGEMFTSFHHMINALSKAFPEKKIILRPHPSENHQNWYNALVDLPNVEMIHKGTIVPWILAADLMIHNSCTTGIEAVLLGKPAFAFREIMSERYDSYLPNFVSLNVRSCEELIHEVELVYSRQHTSKIEEEKVQATLKHYISSFGAQQSSEIMVENLWNLACSGAQPITPKLFRLKDFFYQTSKHAGRKIKHIFNNTQAYANQKFPNFSDDEVRETLTAFGEVNGRFSDICVRHFCKGVVSIEMIERVPRAAPITFES